MKALITDNLHPGKRCSRCGLAVAAEQQRCPRCNQILLSSGCGACGMCKGKVKSPKPKPCPQENCVG